jgi:hypothetical protein
MVLCDMEPSFIEIARVVKPGGRCVITYFLLNPESRKRIDLGLNSIIAPFPHETDACRVADKASPETTVAHVERAIRDLYERNGLSSTGFSYGYWCGRRHIVGSLQGVIMAVKE